MTTLHLYGRNEIGSNDGENMIQQQREDDVRCGIERRAHRRYDFEQHAITLDRWNGCTRSRVTFGQIVDLSAGGVRIRTTQTSLRPDTQIRVRLELPPFAGICPFVDTTSGQPRPKREWTGWLTVSRVRPISGREFEVAGRLVDMEELDRGMLGLYLSTQPMAA